MSEDCKFEDLLGKTLKSIKFCAHRDSGLCNVIVFETEDGIFEMEDSVRPEVCYIEHIDGDVTNSLGLSLSQAEQVTGDCDMDHDHEGEYCFYKLSTGNGDVTLRWTVRMGSWYKVKIGFKKVK